MKHVTIQCFDVIEAQGNYDEARALVDKANAESIGGHTDWVMPDRVTLLALGGVHPYFRQSAWVWSSSPYVGNSRFAWLVDFGDGSVSYGGRSGRHRVRLVRASQLLELGALGHRASIEAAGIVLAEQPATKEKTT